MKADNCEDAAAIVLGAVAAIAGVVIAGAVLWGWVWNIVKLVGMNLDTFSGLMRDGEESEASVSDVNCAACWRASAINPCRFPVLDVAIRCNGCGRVASSSYLHTCKASRPFDHYCDACNARQPDNAAKKARTG